MSTANANQRLINEPVLIILSRKYHSTPHVSFFAIKNSIFLTKGLNKVWLKKSLINAKLQKILKFCWIKAFIFKLVLIEQKSWNCSKTITTLPAFTKSFLFKPSLFPAHFTGLGIAAKCRHHPEIAESLESWAEFRRGLVAAVWWRHPAHHGSRRWAQLSRSTVESDVILPVFLGDEKLPLLEQNRQMFYPHLNFPPFPWKSRSGYACSQRERNELPASVWHSNKTLC